MIFDNWILRYIEGFQLVFIDVIVWKKRSLVFRDSPFSDGHAFIPGTSQHDMPEPQLTKLREGAS